MSEFDVGKIGVKDLEKGGLDEVMLLKLAECSNNSDVLARLADNDNAIIRGMVASNRNIDDKAVSVLEKDRDSGVCRALLKNPTYLAMKRGEVIDITKAVSRRTEDVNPE